MYELVLGLLLTITVQSAVIEDVYEMHKLASIIQGEAGVCSTQGMIAIANVHERNKTFYASSDPKATAIKIAILSKSGLLPDVTNGGEHVFSLSDLQLQRVRDITGDESPLLMIECKDGDMALNIY